MLRHLRKPDMWARTLKTFCLSLFEAADGDVAAAERGIVYVDEIDKITRKSEKSVHNARRKRRGVSSRRFLKFWKALLRPCLRRGAESIRIRSLFRLIPQISCLFAAVHLTALRKSSKAEQAKKNGLRRRG